MFVVLNYHKLLEKKNGGEDTNRCLRPPGVKIPGPGFFIPGGEVTQGGGQDTREILTSGVKLPAGILTPGGQAAQGSR